MELTVPYFSQRVDGLNGPDEDDPNGCWYACAKMIGVYYEGTAGKNRKGVPQLDANYWKQQGVPNVRWNGHLVLGGKLAGGVDSFQVFTTNEHLVALPFNPSWSIADLDAALQHSGPILYFWWAPGWDRNQAFGHASVVIGTDTSSGFRDVLFHDPAVAPRQSMSISRFNELKQPVAMLVRAAGKVMKRDPYGRSSVVKKVVPA
jgi:hypothetical protein